MRWSMIAAYGRNELAILNMFFVVSEAYSHVSTRVLLL